MPSFRNWHGCVPQQAVLSRHCERSEAIHSCFLVASWIASRSLSSGAHARDPLARNDGKIRLRILAARGARVCSKVLPSENQRAQGKPGARCTRSRACSVESTRVSHHRSTGTPGLPCAMVLTAYFALSLATGLCCHHRRRNCFHQLDASVGASGPHDFAVRRLAPSSTRYQRPPHPAPNVRDDRETPLL
jgi:hypothetical protein